MDLKPEGPMVIGGIPFYVPGRNVPSLSFSIFNLCARQDGCR